MSKEYLLETILAMAEQLDGEFGRGDRLKMTELTDVQMMAFYYVASDKQLQALEDEQRRKRMEVEGISYKD